MNPDMETGLLGSVCANFTQLSLHVTANSRTHKGTWKLIGRAHSNRVAIARLGFTALPQPVADLYVTAVWPIANAWHEHALRPGALVSSVTNATSQLCTGDA